MNETQFLLGITHESFVVVYEDIKMTIKVEFKKIKI